MQVILFESKWRIREGECYSGSNEEPCGSFLAADGVASHSLEKELSTTTDVEGIISRLLALPDAWCIVYYRADLRRLFVGRDIFGRYSLVWTKSGANELIFSVAVNSAYQTEWSDVPYGQVTAVELNKLSALMVSFLDEYPDSADVLWKMTFAPLEYRHNSWKDKLITIDNAVSTSGEEYLQILWSKLLDITRNLISPEDSQVAVAFSGGIDSLLIAVDVLRSAAPNMNIFLVNVAFGINEKAWNDAPDRKRALLAWDVLKKLDTHNQLQLILVNVTPEKLDKHRARSIYKVAPPAVSVLDDSLACVLWFALRAKGINYNSGNCFTVPAQKFFVGSGADELFAGYARHRTRFEKEGIQAVVTECEMELRRLGNRNGGRDARVAKQLQRTLIAPFLIDDFVKWANSIPITAKCNLSLPRGEGEKKIIRDCLKLLGLPHSEPKQAMQFGSRMAKLTNSTKLIKGSDLSKHLQCKTHL